MLAPTFTLETIAKILLVSFGSLTGIPKVEAYAWFAVVLTFVNFVVYMTFFPAALSLILELMYTTDGRARWDVRQIIQSLPSEDGYSPAVHKVSCFIERYVSTVRHISYTVAVHDMYLEGMNCTYIKEYKFFRESTLQFHKTRSLSTLCIIHCPVRAGSIS